MSMNRLLILGHSISGAGVKQKAIEINMSTFNLIGFTFRSRENLVHSPRSLFFFTVAFSYHCFAFGVNVTECFKAYANLLSFLV